jgi:hypothetical protein
VPKAKEEIETIGIDALIVQGIQNAEMASNEK